jgi:hypothetical protein
MSSLEWRCAIAVLVGFAFEVVFIWRFQPYSQRELHHAFLPLYALPILAFLAGFVLTLGLQQNRRYVAISLVAAFCGANICLIVVDCWNDPTNHNLWPFEFVLIFALTAPAFLGARVSLWLHRARATSPARE